MNMNGLLKFSACTYYDVPNHLVYSEPIWKVARYTTAAPMYFTECDNYVDGGVLANNPCIDGLNKIQSFYQDHPFPIKCMVSIGSGIVPTQQLGPVDFHLFLRLKFSGMLKKAQSLITMLSSAVSDVEYCKDHTPSFLPCCLLIKGSIARTSSWCASNNSPT